MDFATAHAESGRARHLSRMWILGLVLLAGSCGGSTVPNPVSPSSPDFTISIEFPTINVQQQGQGQGEGIQVNPLNGFTGTVNFVFQGLTTGVSATPGGTVQISVTNSSSQSQYVTLSASTAAAVSSSTVTLIGTSGSISHSKTFTLAVQKMAPFQLSFSMNAVALSPATQIQVSAIATMTAGTIPPAMIFSVAGLPQSTGVALNQRGNLTVTNTSVSQSLVLTADVTAATQTFPLTVVATSGTDTSSAVLQVSVSNPFQINAKLTRSTFQVTDGDVTGAVYDSARKLVFTTVESLNEVVVFSSINGNPVATISVDRPRGIDETIDGSAVYVGSYGNYLAVIDPDSLQVTRRVLGPGTAAPVWVTTLSNGKALVIGQFGATSITQIYMWDPKTDVITSDAVPGFNFPFFMVRSADHSKVLIQGLAAPPVTTFLYDVVTDMFTATPASIGEQATAALSPDGTQVAAWDGQMSVIFYDSQFNELASLPLQGQNNGAQRLIYSRDGLYLYGLADLYPEFYGSVVTVIDAHTFRILGIEPDIANIPFDIDETGMIFGGPTNGFGLALLDATAPGSLQFPVFNNFQIAPNIFSLTSPTQANLTLGIPSQNPAAQYRVFFGGSPATPGTQSATSVSVQSPSVLAVTAPPGKSQGPSTVTVERSDGWYRVEPDAVSYGPPEITEISANAGSASGGSNIFVWGYGFDPAAMNNNQVTIGGAPATFWQGPEVANTSGNYPYPLQVLSVTTPPGSPGLADVTVKTSQGSTTFAGGFQYLTDAEVFPVTGQLQQIVYDQKRQRLYAANADHNRVEVFSLASKAFLSPISVGDTPVAIALSPDGAKLAAANVGDGTVTVINPDSAAVLATYPVLSSGDTNKLCGGQVFSLTPIEGQRMFVGIVCVNLLDQGDTHLLNLNTGSLSCSGITGCSADGSSFGGLTTMVSTPDGTKVFSLGGLLNLDSNTEALPKTAVSAPLAINADANITSALILTPLGGGILYRANFDSQQNEVSLLQDRPSLQVNTFDELNGTQVNPSGSLVFQPFEFQSSGLKQPTQGVEIYDVQTGHLAARVALPEPIAPVFAPMVLDETGSKMFFISNSGITVAQLHEVPLSIATANPSSGPPGADVTIRGSGFKTGATVTFGNVIASTTLIDGNTLQASVPAILSGNVRVTVTNPGGRQYSYDDLFTVQ